MDGGHDLLDRVMGHSISMDEVCAYELQLQSCSGSSLSFNDAMELMIMHMTVDLEEEGERMSTAHSESSCHHETEAGPGPGKDEICVITFTELKVLIENRREDLIPNNKIIPDMLNVSSVAGIW